jgi:hypothetical protein
MARAPQPNARQPLLMGTPTLLKTHRDQVHPDGSVKPADVPSEAKSPKDGAHHPLALRLDGQEVFVEVPLVAGVSNHVLSASCQRLRQQPPIVQEDLLSVPEIDLTAYWWKVQTSSKESDLTITPPYKMLKHF